LRLSGATWLIQNLTATFAAPKKIFGGQHASAGAAAKGSDEKEKGTSRCLT